MDEFRLMTLAITAASVPMSTWAMTLHVRSAMVRRRKRKVVSRMMSAYRPMPLPGRRSQWAWMRWGGPRRVDPAFALEVADIGAIAAVGARARRTRAWGLARLAEAGASMQGFLVPGSPRGASLAAVLKFAATVPPVLTMLAPA